MMRLRAGLALLLGLAPNAFAQQHPTAETAAWWEQTTALSSDAMQGRDTGSEAYERAARYVADQFAAAGLKPAGESGTFFQRVPMAETDVDAMASSIVLTVGGRDQPLKLLEEMTLVPRDYTSMSVDAPLAFVGYGMPAGEDLTGLAGKIVVLYNNTPTGLSAAEQSGFAARRASVLRAAKVSAVVSIDNPAAIEPTHWPAAYARSVVIAPAPVNAMAQGPLQMRISAEAAGKLFAGSGHDYAEVLQAGEKGAPLEAFPLKASLRVHVVTTSKAISSPNILAVLTGSDPKLAGEYVALSAHLDGYGYGTPVLGDSLYNGTLDDAAYVALLLELAKGLQGKPPARSLIFCVFTGEEKGLLGSAYFTAHPTVSHSAIVADLNLDQLRPIFPLKILTMEGLDDSSLGGMVRELAAKFRIEIRPDREPERNLYRRADNYNFVRIGVPIASFIFGYDPGSAEERVYRDWYARRYHKPQDDLATPIDWQAAAAFNRFYGELAVIIANAPVRPAWVAGSPNAPKGR